MKFPQPQRRLTRHTKRMQGSRGGKDTGGSKTKTVLGKRKSKESTRPTSEEGQAWWRTPEQEQYDDAMLARTDPDSFELPHGGNVDIVNSS